MPFHELAPASGHMIFAPWQVAWRTEPQKTSATPPLDSNHDLSFYEDSRNDGKLLLIVMRIIDGTKDPQSWKRRLRDMFRDPHLANNRPAELLRRLHSWISNSTAAGEGALDAAVVLFDGVEHHFSTCRAGPMPDPVHRSGSRKWDYLRTVPGSRLGLPGTGIASGGKADEEVFPSRGESVLGNGAVAVRTIGVSAARAEPGRPEFAFEVEPVDGLFPALDETPLPAPVTQIVSDVFRALEQFSGVTFAQYESTLVAAKLEIVRSAENPPGE